MDQTVIRIRVRWAIRALRALGLTGVQRPARVFQNPWSLIARIATDQGAFWLKYVRGAYRQEPRLTRALHDLAPAHVPELIASDDALACWITRDAGDPLAIRTEPGQGLPILSDVLASHATLQKKTLNQADQWFGLGAKDVRPARFVQYLHDIRAARDDLIRDQVAPETIDSLQTVESRLAVLANRLGAMGMPETVTHMDLRLTNIRRTGLIDWGDAGYGPAFLDLVPLFSELATVPAARNGASGLLNGALAHWADHGTAADLEQAHALCRIVCPMLYAHGLIHARPNWDATLDPSHNGLLRFYLMTFLKRVNG